MLGIAKKRPLILTVALDPDVEEQAIKLAQKLVNLGSTISLASFPIKPDDFLLEYGIDVTNEVLRQAIKIRKS